MEDPFIVSTTLAGIKPSGDSRRLIRRHVMKGKNTKSIKTLSRQKTVDPLLNTVCRMHTPVTTMDLATMGFPVDLEPYMIELITKFFVIVEETGSPLFRCTEKGSPTSPYDMIYNDLAHLHIILFMAQTYFDSKLRKHTQHSQHTITSEQALFPAHQHQPSRRALLHMNKAIEHLQRKLAVPDLSTSLSAVFVVLCLGTCAENTGNLELAEKHLRGMHQIIESRGGIHSLDSYPLVRLKCCRFDIDLSLKTGRRPLLVSNVSWKAYLADSCSLLGHKPDFSYYGHSESRSTPLHTSPDTRVPPDARLANVWNDLATICRSFNLALQLGRKVDILLSNEVLVSIMYRLQNLEGAYQTPGSSTHDPGDWKREVSTSSPASLFPASAAAHEIPQAARAGEHGDDAEDLHGEQDRRQLHELVRVTMLAFMTTIFFEPHGLDSEYVLLSRQLLTAISAAFQRLEEAEEARSPCEKCGHSNNNNNNNNNSSVTPSTETLKLYLWILYAARISLFTGTTAARHPGFSAWLHDKQVELRRVLGLETWAKTRAVLKSFPWVDAVHDAPGKVFYDARGSEATGGGGEGEGVILPAHAGMSGLYRGDVAICTGRGV